MHTSRLTVTHSPPSRFAVGTAVVDIPPAPPEVVPLPPSPRPVPPPPEVPPEITDPIVPGQNVPVREPVQPMQAA
jgi:hypothetical protein